MAVPTFPPIEPTESGLLDVGDGQQIYWETSGNPAGKPALVVHGGPGSGGRRGFRRVFDPEAYRIVLFDQRGCGESRPHAGDPSVGLEQNTTEHLIADMERLREHLGIDRRLLLGGSWGSTLILAYAERHPERVSEIIIIGVTMTGPEETHWLYHGVGRLLPGPWEAFRDALPVGERDGDLVAAYNRLLSSPDASVREKAARDWPSGTVQRPPRRRPDGLRPDLRAFLRPRRLAGGRPTAAGRPPPRRHPGGADPRAARQAARSGPPGSWPRPGRTRNCRSSTTPATPAAPRCARPS